MLSKIQLLSLRNIYQLFTNISDYSTIWVNEIKESDEINLHIEKLTIIMNLISNISEKIEGELDDIIIIVEENLKEYIMQKFSETNENKNHTDSDERI
jgi:hypothetical protein